MSRKSPELPGMEAESIPALEKAADNYVSVRDKRMKLTESEITAKANLIQVAEEHRDKLALDGGGNRVYRYDDLIVIVTDKRNVKVKTARDAEDEDEE